jgi:uncharacterized protein YbjT (DUF2867 family)
MKIAITTPTGHVGSAVTDFLLEAGGCRVKLLGRRPHTLTKFVQRGAETAIGSQDDAEFLARATRDVDALFWVTPPGYGSDNLRAYQNRLGKAAATTIRTNRIRWVVNLSSIGAEWASGVGPIAGLHDVEELLDGAATNITHLRPGFFFENLLWQMDAIRQQGRISLPLSGNARYPMIATRDIGQVAAHLLTTPTWKGQNIQELHGPADLTFNEVAQTLSDVFGRAVMFVRCEPREARDAIVASGTSENAADLMLEMYDAVDTGRIRPLQPRSEKTTTSTTLAEFAHEVMLPLLAQPVPR